jgi:hydrogenase-4 component B
LSLALAYTAVLAALASGIIALGADLRPAFLKIGSFVLLGVSGVTAVLGGGASLLTGSVYTDQLPLGLPWLQWHLRLDPLSGFFMVIVGLVVSAIALYGPGYVREYQHGKQPLPVLGLFTGLFIAGMLLVLIADDAFAFMVAWELMSVSSYVLVAYQHQHAANRRAAFLYLLMAQVGALAILLGFGVLAGAGKAGDFSFDALRHAHLALNWASVAFGLALFGFGMKAGLVPAHAWLPDAHPVAPSHISALMSGVMLKVAVYGFIRFTFDLVGNVHWAWGVVTLLIGSASALLGILYALMQNNLKRLLAYSSIENLGIVFMGLGLAMIFIGAGHPALGVLALIAALYHALNHAMFKSLLFLGAGAVISRSHESDLEQMGGLIRRMPQTAFLFLIGCISISALPPFNGFASEWLTFQAALQAPVLASGVLRSVIPVTAAVLALTAALSAACFVKVFGVAFLGRARSRHVRHAREVSLGMRAGQGLLAVLCVLLGVLPTWVVSALDAIPQLLLGSGLPNAAAHGWLWLTPIAREMASYSAPLVVLGVGLAWGIGWLLLHRQRSREQRRRGYPWDCGFGALNARMQYTSTAFSMPIRRIFAPVWRIDEQIEETADKVQPLRVASIRHQLQIGDHSWTAIYEPLARTVLSASRLIGRIQTGSIRTYLGYSFFTLILLLWLIT